MHTMKSGIACVLGALLAACGGDNADPALAGSQQGSVFQPTIWTSEGRTLNSCLVSPGCTDNPHAPFFSFMRVAPHDGSVLSGIVRLEVSGNDMANIEVLPATGYLPRHGVFNISGDTTLAWLDLDTRTLPNGPVQLRVSAFNVPAGQPGAVEIVTMPVRTWTIANPGAAPVGFNAAVTAAPSGGAVVSGVTRLELRGSGIVNAELLPAQGYTPRLGVFNVSEDGTHAWLDFDSKSLPDGVASVRISAYNAAEGQPGAGEIVAMPARQWLIGNGMDGSFAARVTVAPAHGAVVSGRTRIEVRGNGLENVELLPAEGYLPRLGVFNVSYDKTYAWLELDTTTLPAGIMAARISAFNVPAGQPGAVEILAMPARQWELQP